MSGGSGDSSSEDEFYDGKERELFGTAGGKESAVRETQAASERTGVCMAKPCAFVLSRAAPLFQFPLPWPSYISDRKFQTVWFAPEQSIYCAIMCILIFLYPVL